MLGYSVDQALKRFHLNSKYDSHITGVSEICKRIHEHSQSGCKCCVNTIMLYIIAISSNDIVFILRFQIIGADIDALLGLQPTRYQDD